MKVLIVVLDNLGDAVMATALLGPLRRRYPQAELGLWVKEYASGLFDLEGVRIHAADPFWDKAPGRGKGPLGPFVRALREIRSVGYDLALVLNADWRRSLACLCAGIENRVGHRRHQSGLFLTRSLSERKCHVVEAHADLLAAWTQAQISDDDLLPQIGLSEEQKERGRSWRKSLGWEKNTVAVTHATTGDPEKNWPLAHWHSLFRILRAQRPKLRFVVLSSALERPLLEDALGDAAAIICGSVAEMKPVLSQADFFIGGDSGPGHMAAALGAPVLSLFGPTDPGRYRPVGGKVQVICCDPLTKLAPETVAIQFSALLEGKGLSPDRCTS